MSRKKPEQKPKLYLLKVYDHNLYKNFKRACLEKDIDMKDALVNFMEKFSKKYLST